MRKGLKILARIQLAAGATEIIIPSFSMTVADSIKQASDIDPAIDSLQFKPGITIISSAHMQSSAKMGASPSIGVIDTSNKVFGAEGLWVIDASSVPTSVGANPMQTLYALARIASKWLGETLR